MLNKLIDNFIELAIAEDQGDGDHTSLACIPRGTKGIVKLLIKQKGILAGCKIAEKVFHTMDKEIKIEHLLAEGMEINPGDIAFHVSGSVHTILQAERIVLNIMQRMSGIATQTRKYVQKLEGLQTKILDTRKTTPGMRLLDKAAVKIGGGTNHRIGLFDMILIKDNHIDFAGGIKEAIERTKEYLISKNKSLKIEVEARSISDVKTILSTGGVDRILLDNFSIDDTLKAVKIIDKKTETESSGGITLKNLRSYAECGVDYISVGALTHQIQSLDMSLKAVN